MEWLMRPRGSTSVWGCDVKGDRAGVGAFVFAGDILQVERDSRGCRKIAPFGLHPRSF